MTASSSKGTASKDTREQAANKADKGFRGPNPYNLTPLRRLPGYRRYGREVG